jgi:hypothetical protein
MAPRNSTQMKFTLTFRPTCSTAWPAVKIYVNDCLVLDQAIDSPICEFFATLDAVDNQLRVSYYNKNESHTVVDAQGRIVSDQCLELCKLHIDDILVGSWMLTEGHYRPTYFEGFLLQNPSAPAQLKSQLIWHFPGDFYFPVLPSEQQFWWWYRDQRRYVHAKTHQAKDNYRDEAYIGSLESHQDLINEIRKLINV